MPVKVLVPFKVVSPVNEALLPCKVEPLSCVVLPVKVKSPVELTLAPELRLMLVPEKVAP